MARPTKLDAQRQKKIVELIRAGNYQETAARAAGVSPSSFYAWMAIGEEASHKTARLNAKDKACLEFSEAVKAAKAEAEARAVAIINKAAMDGTWQAAAWYLERTASERFGRSQRIEASIEHEQKGKAPAEMTDEELLAYLKEHGLGDD